MAEEYEDRIFARAASKGCEHCGGDGLASVWHPTPSHEKQIPATVAAYCTCPHGRWIKRSHAFSRECKQVTEGFPDLADVMGGRSIWLAGPPDLDSQDGREAFLWLAHKAMFRIPTETPTAAPCGS